MENIMKIEFQIYDWSEDNIINDDNNDDNNIGEYIINIFGRCMDHKSIYVRLINFTPFFHIKLPEDIPEYKLNKLHERFKEYLLKFSKIGYKFRQTLKRIELKKLKCSEGFTNNKEEYYLRLIFTNVIGMKKYIYYLENNKITTPDFNNHQFKLYESNLLPMLCCFHIRKISGCSWVEVSKYNHLDDVAYCDIEIETDWKNISPIKKDINAPLRICSFDIECYSKTGDFPLASNEDDKIIQIGATYTYLGNSVPYRQYIACLDNTTQQEDIETESFNTEYELLLGFKKEIIENDCDIITGYNIFNFDEKYIFDRCKYLDEKYTQLHLVNSILHISKLKYHKCEFKDIRLSSSALGDNILRFIDTPGRVHVDIMKDIQKTSNLQSYKLDYVSSYFIRGIINNFIIINDNKIELECQTIDDITINDFIHIEVLNNVITDTIGNKYQVLNIDKINKKIKIQSDSVLINELQSLSNVKLFWSQAKDDVSPKDIFKLFKGSNDDRGTVAKYCIKDCKLVSLLINKLEIITKNLEMANVCFVPLSYLFIRGQGIKLFSLCMKEFKSQKYAFPVLKPNRLYKCCKCNNEFYREFACPKCKSHKKEEIELESTTYEGAIVFDPVPRVEYEALAVKDYMSLYPASIMHKNMSHETIVENEIYDNLPEIEYFNAQYKEQNGVIKYCRYAKVNNQLGIIPTILYNLLNERKLIKQQMKIEKDEFKLKILDAKQYAIKITANSLYGQLGSSLSPICKREIAACTTSTGREMLLAAKKFDEEQLPYIINSLKYYHNINDINNYNNILSSFLKNKDDKTIVEITNYIEKIKDVIIQPIVRYGDSVIGSTPLLIRCSITKRIFIVSIKELGLNATYRRREDNKEYINITNLEIWTDKEWTKITQLIRHKNKKKLFQVTTSSGSVVVTEDHSLILSSLKIIKPHELNIGIELLHSFPKINNLNEMILLYNKQIINYDIAMLFGFILQYGIIKINSIIVKHNNNNILNKYITLINTYFENICIIKGINYFNINIETNTNNIFLIDEIYKICIHNNKKYISPIILNAPSIIQKGYWDGMFEGYKKLRIKLNNKCIALGLYTLGKLLNYKCNINYKNKKYFLNFDINDELYSVTSINEWLLHEDYVYDLSTENHHFHAGVGSLIVHNTDSIFSCYGFKENCVKVNDNEALSLWKKVIEFGNILIKPFFDPLNALEFNTLFNEHYNINNITNLTLPNIQITDNNIIKLFIKEYMEENYLPWLWTLIDLVERNNINMFDIKLSQWAEYLLSTKRLYAADLFNDCKHRLIDPLLKLMTLIFPDNIYIPITNDHIQQLYDITSQMNLNIDAKLYLKESCDLFLRKTIKEKWINSDMRIELKKIIISYLKSIATEEINTRIKSSFVNLIIDLKKSNTNLVEYLSTTDIGISINKEILIQQTKMFEDKYIKNNGAKTMSQLIEEFIEKTLQKLFIQDKKEHYDNVIDFIKNNLLNFWIQSRKHNNIIYIDIYKDGNLINDARTVEYTIKMGDLSSKLIKQQLPYPHDCEYEKTYYPIAFISKKKYVGNKYEFDINKYKLDFMGIVLKRRDNAPIVKEICSGIIDNLINKKNPNGAKQYTINCLNNMFAGLYDIKYFIQSRSLKLKESYKDWQKIAHVYLADKITQRSPGESPVSGDRIEYAIVKRNNINKVLQGELIETPKYIIENQLEIDYLFYLTNQIQNPALQLLELVDNNVKSIFNNFIQKYSAPKNKIKKIKHHKLKENYILEIKNLISDITKKSKLLHFKLNPKLLKFINKI